MRRRDRRRRRPSSTTTSRPKCSSSSTSASSTPASVAQATSPSRPSRRSRSTRVCRGPACWPRSSSTNIRITFRCIAPSSASSGWRPSCHARPCATGWRRVPSLLTPLWQLLKHWVLQSKVLHTDDTTVPVRDETKSNHRYGRLWDYIGDEAHPGIVFDYTVTHARDGPAEFLKGFQGFLQADAYGGYDGIYTGSNGRSSKSTKHKAIINKGLVKNGQDEVVSGQAAVISTATLLALVQWLRSRLDQTKGESPCSSRTSHFPPVHSKRRKTGRHSHAAARPPSAATSRRNATPADTGSAADGRSATHSSRKPKGGKP